VGYKLVADNTGLSLFF